MLNHCCELEYYTFVYMYIFVKFACKDLKQNDFPFMDNKIIWIWIWIWIMGQIYVMVWECCKAMKFLQYEGMIDGGEGMGSGKCSFAFTAL